MANMRPPTVPEVPVPVVSDGELKKLLKTTEGKEFEKRRDAAILRVLIDCGIRLGELTNFRLDEVDFETQVLVMLGKGSRPRSVPFGAKTGQALDRYLRVRKGHHQASSPMLWLGSKGLLGDSGVSQMLRRRCADAGIDQLRSIEHGLDFDPRRQRRDDGAQAGVDRGGNGAAVGADQHQRGADHDFAPVLAGAAGTGLAADRNGGDVADPHRHAAAGGDHDRAEVLDAFDAAAGAHHDAFAVALDVACAAAGCLRRPWRDPKRSGPARSVSRHPD